MNIDRVEIRKGNYDFNNETLRKDVEGVRCTMRVVFPRFQGAIDIPDEAGALLKDDERISSAEVYLSGAVNIFVQDAVACVAVAVIRIRPVQVPLSKVDL